MKRPMRDIARRYEESTLNAYSEREERWRKEENERRQEVSRGILRVCRHEDWVDDLERYLKEWEGDV